MITLICSPFPSQAQKKNKKKRKNKWEKKHQASEETILEVERTLYWGEDFRISTPESALVIETYISRSRKKHGEYTKMRLSDSLVLIQGEFDNGLKVGEWLYFYPNGTLRKKESFEELPVFPQTYTIYEFFESGLLQAEWVRTANSKKLIHCFSPKGNQTVMDGNGLAEFYSDDGTRLVSTCEYVNGFRNGEMKVFSENQEIKEIHLFESGKFIETTTEAPEVEAVLPEYPGGDVALRKEVARNYKIPQRYMESGGSLAKLKVRFLVGTEGDIEEIYALTNYGSGLEAEAIRTVNSLSKKFKPAMEDGKVVSTMYVLPIVIKIE